MRAKIIQALLLCLVLFLAIKKFKKWKNIFDSDEKKIPGRVPVSILPEVPPSLKRKSHTTETLTNVRGKLVNVEYLENFCRAPTEDELKVGINILKEARGFHARHIWADWFYRRAVVKLLKSPTPELAKLVKDFFLHAMLPGSFYILIRLLNFNLIINPVKIGISY